MLHMGISNEYATGPKRPLTESEWYLFHSSMKSLHIRNVDPNILAALKRLAKSHHRSLQGELHTILERAARTAPPEQLEAISWITVETGRATSTWSRNEIYDDDGR